MNNLVRFCATFFYIGYLPFAPGSTATIAGALLYFALRQHLVVYVLLFAAITWIGFAVSGRMEDLCTEKDPSCIVIDEVSGVMIAFFMLPWNPPVVWTAFFLFRAFDMFKIYPVNKFEEHPGGTSIMMDDIMAGIYTNLTMHLAIRLAGMG